MVDTSEFTQGRYLNSTTCEESDIVEILHEGEIGEIEKDGKVKKVLNIAVKCNGKDFIYTPATKSLKKLQEIFQSTDSSKWVGQKFQVHIIDMEVAGKELKVIRPRAIK